VDEEVEDYDALTCAHASLNEEDIVVVEGF